MRCQLNRLLTKWFQHPIWNIHTQQVTEPSIISYISVFQWDLLVMRCQLYRLITKWFQHPIWNIRTRQVTAQMILMFHMQRNIVVLHFSANSGQSWKSRVLKTSILLQYCFSLQRKALTTSLPDMRWRFVPIIKFSTNSAFQQYLIDKTECHLS